MAWIGLYLKINFIESAIDKKKKEKKLYYNPCDHCLPFKLHQFSKVHLHSFPKYVAGR